MKSTVDIQEVNKFSQHSEEWWNPKGALKTLHDINPIRLQYVLSYAGHLNDKNLLDVGCGGGIFSEALARNGAVVTGLDVEASAIAVAKRHAEQNNLNINYVCSPLELFINNKNKENSINNYSVITCMEMLEHVKHPEQIIQNCAQLLEPEGLLFLSTFNRTPKAYLMAILGAEYVLNLLPRQTHDYDKFIKPSELVFMIESAGLQLVGMSGLSYNPWSGQATLSSSVAVNYMLCCQKM